MTIASGVSVGVREVMCRILDEHACKGNTVFPVVHFLRDFAQQLRFQIKAFLRKRGLFMGKTALYPVGTLNALLFFAVIKQTNKKRS
jgi:hypothetical protein